MEDVFLPRGDKRRDHDRALAGGIIARGDVVVEGLGIAETGSLGHGMADMDRCAEGLGEEFAVADRRIEMAIDLDIGLDAEELGLEALGSEASRIHLNVLNHRLELALAGERAEEGHLGEEGGIVVGIQSRRNRRTTASISGGDYVGIQSRRNRRTTVSISGGDYVGIQFRRNRRTTARIERTQVFGGLPEATHDELDATGHGAPDVDDSMEMIGHDTELKDTDLGEALVEMEQALNEVFGEGCLGHVSAEGVVIGDDEIAQQGLPTGDGKRHMIDTDAFPGRTALLPLPIVMRSHSRTKSGTKVQKNREICKRTGEKMI